MIQQLQQVTGNRRPKLWLMINCAYVNLSEDPNRLLTNSEVRLMLLLKYFYSVIT